jgi:hypothetical protein
MVMLSVVATVQLTAEALVLLIEQVWAAAGVAYTAAAASGVRNT